MKKLEFQLKVILILVLIALTLSHIAVYCAGRIAGLKEADSFINSVEKMLNQTDIKADKL